MKKNIAVIFGDGIGPEVTQQSINVLDAIAKTLLMSLTILIISWGQLP